MGASGKMYVPSAKGTKMQWEWLGKKGSIEREIMRFCKEVQIDRGERKDGAEMTSQTVGKNQYDAFTRFHVIHLSLGTQAPLTSQASLQYN